MRNHLRILFPLLLLTLFVSQVHAAKRYWVGGTSNSYKLKANWSTVSGGAGGATIPGSSDTAFFDGAAVRHRCNMDSLMNVKRLGMSGDTLSQGANTITIGAGGAILSGGVFLGGSSNITVSGVFTISGNAFTSTSGTFSTSANLTISSGSFADNSGTVSITASSTLTISITGGVTFYNLTFAPSASTTITVTSTTSISVSNLLSYSGSSAVTLNTGTINAKGNIYMNNSSTAGGGSATITVNGTGTQTVTGTGKVGEGRLPNFTINKSSSDTIKFVDTVSVGGNWTYTAGKLSAGTSTVAFYDTKNINGTFSLYNVFFGGTTASSYTIGSTLTINGLFKSKGSNAVTLNSGTINAKGNIDVRDNSGAGGGSATLIVNGTGNQKMYGTTNAAGRFCHFQINKSSSDTLFLYDGLTFAGNFTYTSGVVIPGSSSMIFLGSKTITGSITLGNAYFTGTTASTFTIATGTTLTLNGSFIWQGTSNQMTLNGGTINIHTDIVINNTSNASGGYTILEMNGTGNQTITGAASQNQGCLPNVKINKSSGTLTITNIVSVAGNWTYLAGTIASGSGMVYFTASKSITGSHALYDVVFASGYTYTITSGTTLTVTGTLTVQGGGATTFDTGVLNPQGNISVTNSSSSTGGSASVLIDGTANQTWTGSGTAGQGKLPNVTINKTGGTLTLNGLVSITGDWTYTAGTVAPGTSKVAMYGRNNLNGTGGGATMPFYDLTIAGNKRSLTGNINVTHNLTINASDSLAPSTYTINVGNDWVNNGVWSFATSTVVFNGTTYGAITKASGTETFYNLKFNRTSGKSQRLLCPVTVNNVLTLTKGHVKTTSTNYLTLIDNATVSGGSDSAYVHGPMRKTGDDVFTFPLGDTTLNDTAYHPLGMTTAPSSTSDQFEATYFASLYPVGDSLVDSLESVSHVEYWKLERMSGSSSVNVRLGWNRNSSNVEDLNTLRVVGWNGVKWLDYGAAAVVVDGTTGTLTSSLSPVYSSGVAVLAIGIQRSSVPYALLKKKLDGGYYQTLNGRLYFRFDEEYNTDLGENLRFNIYDDQHTLVTSDATIPSSLQQLVYYGDNRFKLNTVQCYFTSTGPLPNGFYTLEVINDKNEHWYLRFKQVTNITLNDCLIIPTH